LGQAGRRLTGRRVRTAFWTWLLHSASGGSSPINRTAPGYSAWYFVKTLWPVKYAMLHAEPVVAELDDENSGALCRNGGTRGCAVMPNVRTQRADPRTELPTALPLPRLKKAQTQCLPAAARSSYRQRAPDGPGVVHQACGKVARGTDVAAAE
jgi:hypothetical protein